MTTGASDDAEVGWPFPAALTISAPSWQSELTRQGQVPLLRPRLVIGNDAACEIALLDDAVAPRHAAITWTADGYQIEDLGSVNGTWVDGKRIVTPAPLALGASIRIGGVTLLFTSPGGEQTTMLPGALPTHVATPSAPGATPAQPPALNLGTPLRVASPPPADRPPADPQDTPTPARRPATVPVRTAAPPSFPSPSPYTPPPQPAPPAPIVRQAPAATAQAANLPLAQPQPVHAPQQPAPLPTPPAQPSGFASAAPPQMQPPARMPASGDMAVPGQRFDFSRWLAEQQPRFYWKFFLLGLVVLIIAEVAASSSSNFIPVMMIILLYSSLAPITFVIFFWEQGGSLAEFSPIVLVAAFGSGGTVGLILGSILDGAFNANSNALIPALLVGVAEETGKVAALYYFMRDPGLRKEINGLLLGTAAGMGFAALETSGYGFVAFVQGLTQGGTFSGALDAANQQLFARMLLAIFGHGVWTAIVCSAIWRERGNQTFAATRGVIIAFLIAVGLHGLWDFSIGQGWLPITIGNGVYPGFDVLIVGPLGLLILSFFLREAIEQAQLGPAAPPLTPLDDALKAYFNAIFSRFGGGRPAVPAQPYGTPYPPQAPQSGPYPPQALGQHGGADLTPPYPQQPPRQRPTAYPAAYPPPGAARGQALPQDQLAAPHWPLPSPNQPASQPPVWPLPSAQPSQPPRDPFAEPHPLAHVPYCARCGITYPPGATLCTNCGSPLTEAMGH